MPATSEKRKLPWFVRAGDWLVDRHEHWATDMRDSPEYHQKLLLYVTTGDQQARAWLAEALSRYDYARASRIWMWYLLVVLTVGLFVVMGLHARGCGLVLLFLLPVPLLVRVDRWNRRRIAWNRLAEAKPMIYEKVEIKGPAEGSRIFQSYWKMGDIGPMELDHPIELMPAVEEANEWWQLQLPTPYDDNGGIQWLNAHHDLGLVHRDATGARRLLAGGVVYFPYDPWAQRIDTSGYE